MKVKPLEWKRESRTILGTYSISEFFGTYTVKFPNKFQAPREFDSLREAEAACNRDFESLILVQLAEVDLIP